MRKSGRNVTLVLVLLMLPGFACQALLGEEVYRQEPILTEYRPINLPSGEFGSTLWLGEEILVVFSPGERDHIYDTEIWRFSPKSGDFSRIELSIHSGCESAESLGFRGINTVSETTFSYLVVCRFERSVQMFSYLMLNNNISGETISYWSREFAVPPNGDIGQYSWNPNENTGIASDGQRFSGGQLHWFGPNGFDYVDTGLVTASSPVWSPDGKVIAFFGSTEMQSIFFETDDAIYLMDSDGENVRKLVDGPIDFSDFAWSPDSEWIVLSAKLGEGDQEQNGLWLIEVSSKKYWLLAEGDFSSLAWSQDGESIVIGKIDRKDFATKNLAILDIGDVIRQLEE